MQTQTAQYKVGKTYIAHSPDLAKVLENESGTFEVVHNGSAFLAVCEEGHSIASFIPNGTKNLWLVTKQEPTAVEEDERGRSRASSA